MKKLTALLLGLAVAGAAQVASAFTYNEGDLLLVFRSSTGNDSYNDVVFNIGSVSNYLAMSPGATNVVAYDASIVSAYFSGSQPKFAIIGATKNTNPTLRYWTSDKNLTTTPVWPTYSAWGAVRGKIESVGNNAVSGAPSASYFSTSPSTTLSYSWTVTGGNPYDPVSHLEVKTVGTLNGSVPFTVDNISPTTVALYEFQPVSGQSAPFVGAFTLDAAGTLVFTAKALPPLTPASIVNLTGAAPNKSVTFTSALGNNYDVQAANNVTGPWTSLNNIVPGTGLNQIVNDSNATNSTRYYRVKSLY